MAYTTFIPIVTDGLVFSVDAYNQKSYVSGNTVTNDLSIDNINGTLFGGVGFDGNSWTFDGIDEYIDLGDNLEMGTDDISIGCWINVNSTVSTAGQIFAKTSAQNDPNRYFFNVQSNPLRLGKIRAVIQGNGATFYNCDGSTDLRGVGWKHVVVVWERTSTLRIYIDGELDGTINISTLNGDDIQSSFKAYIGAGNATDGVTPAFFFPGKISSVKLYRKVLSVTEIKQNYNATKWRFQ